MLRKNRDIEMADIGNKKAQPMSHWTSVMPGLKKGQLQSAKTSPIKGSDDTNSKKMSTLKKSAFSDKIARLKKNVNISTISYEDTIIHKYGNKIEQDKFLKFDKKNIIKNINEFC